MRKDEPQFKMDELSFNIWSNSWYGEMGCNVMNVTSIKLL
jgi:hypothetical protein